MLDPAGFRALRLEREGSVLRVTIAHPTSELNAVDELLHDELGRLFRELRRERAARAVLLTGAGRAFSAGGDFGWLATLEDLRSLDPLRRDAKQLVGDLLDVELPIVAALNGPAVGLGASLALLCDVIFMADTASLADPHVRVGIVAGDGGTAIWPLVLGPGAGEAVPADGRPGRRGRGRAPRPREPGGAGRGAPGRGAGLRAAPRRGRAPRRPLHEARGEPVDQADGERRPSTWRRRSRS